MNNEEEEEVNVESSDSDIRRVKIQALDIDWLFYEDNFNTTLEILSESEVDSILIT